MNLDPAWLFLSLIPSGIGFVLFVYGKKQGRWPQLTAGLALLVYPYFTETLTALIVTGIAIGAALGIALRLGW
jgi:multisubunit Na+/H+ antiporter MnhC subunit